MRDIIEKVGWEVAAQKTILHTRNQVCKIVNWSARTGPNKQTDPRFREVEMASEGPQPVPEKPRCGSCCEQCDQRLCGIVSDVVRLAFTGCTTQAVVDEVEAAATKLVQLVREMRIAEGTAERRWPASARSTVVPEIAEDEGGLGQRRQEQEDDDCHKLLRRSCMECADVGASCVQAGELLAGGLAENWREATASAHILRIRRAILDAFEHGKVRDGVEVSRSLEAMYAADRSARHLGAEAAKAAVYGYSGCPPESIASIMAATSSVVYDMDIGQDVPRQPPPPHAQTDGGGEAAGHEFTPSSPPGVRRAPGAKLDRGAERVPCRPLGRLETDIEAIQACCATIVALSEILVVGAVLLEHTAGSDGCTPTGVHPYRNPRQGLGLARQQGYATEEPPDGRRMATAAGRKTSKVKKMSLDEIVGSATLGGGEGGKRKQQQQDDMLLYNSSQAFDILKASAKFVSPFGKRAAAVPSRHRSQSSYSLLGRMEGGISRSWRSRDITGIKVTVATGSARAGLVARGVLPASWMRRLIAAWAALPAGPLRQPWEYLPIIMSAAVEHLYEYTSRIANLCGMFSGMASMALRARVAFMADHLYELQTQTSRVQLHYQNKFLGGVSDMRLKKHKNGGGGDVRGSANQIFSIVAQRMPQSATFASGLGGDAAAGGWADEIGNDSQPANGERGRLDDRLLAQKMSLSAVNCSDADMCGI